MLSGLMIGLAYTFPFLRFLVFVSFVPLISVIISFKNRTKKWQFFSGFLAGFIYFLFVFQWLLSVYPLDGFGITNKFIIFILIFIFYLISAASMAIFWGLFTLTAGVYTNIQTSYKKRFLIFLPFAFIFFEYIRSYAFGLLWSGTSTLFGPHWTLGNIAYLVSSNNLFLYLAQFVGIYGISIVLIVINVLIYFFVINKGMNKKKVIIPIIIISTLVLIPGFFSFPEETGQKVPVAIIQTKNPTNVNISLEEKLTQFNQQLKFLKQIAQIEPTPEIIVFPEGSSFFKNIPTFLNTLQTKNFFENLFTVPVLIIDNSRIIDNEGRFKSRTLYLNSKDGVVGWYDKQLLTPGGEYLPYSVKWIAGFVPKKIDQFSRVRFFNKGDEISSPVSLGNIKTGVLVCSDLFSPSLNRALSGQGSNITIIQTSTGIFKGNRTIIQQNIDIARLRAAEVRKPLMLAANYGQSFIISGSGKIQKITQNSDPQILTVSVVLNNKKTWYGKVGDRPFVMAGFIIIPLLLFIRKKHE